MAYYHPLDYHTLPQALAFLEDCEDEWPNGRLGENFPARPATRRGVHRDINIEWAFGRDRVDSFEDDIIAKIDGELSINEVDSMVDAISVESNRPNTTSRKSHTTQKLPVARSRHLS